MKRANFRPFLAVCHRVEATRSHKPLCLSLSLTPPCHGSNWIPCHGAGAPLQQGKEAQARPSRMGFTLDFCGSRCTISISHTSGTFSQSSTPETPGHHGQVSSTLPSSKTLKQAKFVLASLHPAWKRKIREFPQERRDGQGSYTT